MGEDVGDENFVVAVVVAGDVEVGDDGIAGEELTPRLLLWDADLVAATVARHRLPMRIMNHLIHRGSDYRLRIAVVVAEW